MHARARARPEADLARTAWIRDVVDRETAAHGQCLVSERRIDFVIADHDAVRGAHLVRVQAGRNVHFGNSARMLGIGDVHDRRSMRSADVPDVGEMAIDRDLPAAGTVEITHLAYPFAFAHCVSSFRLAQRRRIHPMASYSESPYFDETRYHRAATIRPRARKPPASWPITPEADGLAPF